MNEIMDIKHPECDSCLMSMILEKASAPEVMAESGRPYSDVPNGLQVLENLRKGGQLPE